MSHHARHRKPSKITATVTGAGILAAAAAVTTAAVTSGGPAAAGQSDALTAARTGSPGARTEQTAGAPRTAPDLEAVKSAAARQAQSSAKSAEQAHEAQLAAQRQAAARRAAERAAAAQQAAARQQAKATATATATPTPSASAAPTPSGSPQQIAMALLPSYGWPSSQFSCLDELWNEESGWNYEAENASGAYGIPQALPGSKMASAGADWATDPKTQIIWGLGYIKSLYGTPCGAWAHEEADGWY
ncbi:MAG: lytic transglycosylase domain-containing protein [Streptosporangiaceae bacterium]